MDYWNLNGENPSEIRNLIFDVLSNMIAITLRGKDGKFIYASPSFLSQLNLTPDDLIGKGSTDLIRENIYQNSSSETSFLTGVNSKEFIDSYENGLVFTESTLIRDEQENTKYVITHCTLTNTILEELNRMNFTLERYKKENQRLHDILLKNNIELIYTSNEMQTLVRNAMKIAPTDASALITGESGVGKDLIARLIHDNSHRKDNPYIPICVPQIASSLLESELFGYEKGSFTGASHTGQRGLLDEANGGTVFFDEIGDVPLDFQVKLLRVLENREFKRIGDTKSTKLDVRFLAATNKDLWQMVKDGTFREDLFYRLNIINLYIEPLRKRKDDIIPLVNYFVLKLNENYNFNKKLSNEVHQIFHDYSWPGNVRELRNMVERLIVLSDENFITAQTVASILQNTSILIPKEDHLNNPILQKVDSEEETLNKRYTNIENRKILDALVQANGNRQRAAEILGISRSTLYRKLNNLKL